MSYSLRIVAFFALAASLEACGGAMQPTDTGVAPPDGAVPDRIDPPMDTGVESDGSSMPPEDVPSIIDSAVGDSGSNPVDTGVSPPSDGGASGDYTGNGPLAASAAGPIALTLPSSTGCAGNDCRVNVFVNAPMGSAPDRAAPFPVVVISNGFQLSASQYQSYAQRLARWGYVVLRWDTTTEGGVIPRSISHRVLGAMLRALPESVAAMGAMGAMMDTRRVVFAGHSRGGKISALASSGNSNAVAFVGFDPVDANPPGTPAGPDYPSGAAALAMFRGRSVMIGAALGGMSSLGMPCAPTASNYQTFFMQSMAPALEVTLAQTGHMQFIDNRSTCGLACTFCPNGTTMDSTVREISQVLLIAASEASTRGVDASAYLTPTGAWLSRQMVAMSRAR
jgi:hypothetical protein